MVRVVQRSEDDLSALPSSAGASCFGMSSVPEAIAAAALGMEVVGVSCITNLAAGLAEEVLEHDSVGVASPLVPFLHAVAQLILCCVGSAGQGCRSSLWPHVYETHVDLHFADDSRTLPSRDLFGGMCVCI